jgi:hypothetical protein
MKRKKPKIPPHNTQRKTKRYLRSLAASLKRWAGYEYRNISGFHFNSNIFPRFCKNDVILILSPKGAHTYKRPDFSTFADALSGSNLERAPCRKRNLQNTPAQILGRGRYDPGYLGESPYEATSSNIAVLCVDGEEREVVNHEVGKDYVFLPNPRNLRRFLELLQEIPKKRLARNLGDRLAKYYASLKRK